MTSEVIKIRGARSNNLKNINVDITKNKITCIAGPSGSGKSSLAYHTLYQESKRRFLNSISSGEKFFWDIPRTVDVDSIYPVLPVWALSQYNPIMASRWTSADIVEVSEALQQIFFFGGSPHCLACDVPLKKQSLYAQVQGLIKKESEDTVLHFFTSIPQYKKLFHGEYPSRGLSESGEIVRVEEEMDYALLKKTRIKNLDSFEGELNNLERQLSELIVTINDTSSLITLKSSGDLNCSKCGEEFREIKDLQQLSATNPLGACQSCDGHGANLEIDREKVVRDWSLSVHDGAVHVLNYVHFEHFRPCLEREMKKQGFDPRAPFCELDDAIWELIEEGSGTYPGTDELFAYLERKKYKKSVRIYLRGFKSESTCSSCEGTRLNPLSLGLKVNESFYKKVLLMRFEEVKDFISSIKSSHPEAKKVINRILPKLKMIDDLGLGHLHLSRKVRTLSGSEYQRLLLVKYICHEGSDGLYILDEPSLGLSTTYQKKILNHLQELVQRNNTVVLVEHSTFFQNNCDELLLLGPAAGSGGGEVTYHGKPKKKKESNLDDLWEKKKLTKKCSFKNVGAEFLEHRDFDIALGGVTWVHGAPGTGKSAYFLRGIANALYFYHEGKNLFDRPIDVGEMKNYEHFEGVYYVDSNLGKVTSRSVVGTYVGLSPLIRKIYAASNEAKAKGLLDGHFSPNSPLGQCPNCEGTGKKVIDLQYFEDVEFTCEECLGTKVKKQAAEVVVNNVPYENILTHEMNEVIPKLHLTSKGKRIYEYLKLLKIDYLSLGRELNTLSGGERQRLKLFSILQKNISNSILFFENLSFGLSEREIVSFALLFEKLRDAGNTVILIDSSETFKRMNDVEVKI